ncbi:MAG: hypothetical protein QQN55_07445 [Nitrosopumilus sp.]
MAKDTRDLLAIAKYVKETGMKCNCDLDNWEPVPNTGHSHVCRIHKKSIAMKFRPYDVKS